MIHVVAAVVEEERGFLLTRRPAGVHLAGRWEFPGGKIAPGESHQAALARELREELDVGIEVGELILETTHAYPDVTVVLYFYRCRRNGVPRPLLGQEMRWVSKAELPALGFPEADAELIAILTRADVR